MNNSNVKNVKFLQRDTKIGRYLFVSKIPVKCQLLQIKGIGRRWLDYYFYANKFSDCKVSEMPVKMRDSITSLLTSNKLIGMVKYKTNYDKHLIGEQLLIRQKLNIKKLQAAKTVRGLRHKLKLKVRGQRTKSTGRKNKKI